MEKYWVKIMKEDTLADSNLPKCEEPSYHLCTTACIKGICEKHDINMKDVELLKIELSK